MKLQFKQWYIIVTCINTIQRVILVKSVLPWKGQPDHFQVK